MTKGKQGQSSHLNIVQLAKHPIHVHQLVISLPWTLLLKKIKMDKLACGMHFFMSLECSQLNSTYSKPELNLL